MEESPLPDTQISVGAIYRHLDKNTNFIADLYAKKGATKHDIGGITDYANKIAEMVILDALPREMMQNVDTSANSEQLVSISKLASSLAEQKKSWLSTDYPNSTKEDKLLKQAEDNLKIDLVEQAIKAAAKDAGCDKSFSGLLANAEKSMVQNAK